jgi:hypothetical protein
VTICTELMPGAPTPTPPPSTNAAPGRRFRGRFGPGNLDVLWVGR